MIHVHTYSDTLYSRSIMVCGPVPPPLGGVSVHVQRLIYKLKKQGNCVVTQNTESLYKNSWALTCIKRVPLKYLAQLIYIVTFCMRLIRKRPAVIIYHMCYARTILPELVVMLIYRFFSAAQVMLVEHDCRHMYERTHHFKKFFSWSMRYVDMLVIIGTGTAQSYRDNGVSKAPRTIIESAFLPPQLDQEARIWDSYPLHVARFLAQHRPSLLMNAYQICMWHGKDLYGIDAALELLVGLRTRYSDIGLLIVLGSVGDVPQYQILKNYIDMHTLSNAVCLVEGQKELWPLMKKVDLFIRPTVSDGASVSVQEALYFGLPVVASNVCERPPSVSVYRIGDQQDFTAKVVSAIEKKGDHYAQRNRNYMHP